MTQTNFDATKAFLACVYKARTLPSSLCILTRPPKGVDPNAGGYLNKAAQLMLADWPTLEETLRARSGKTHISFRTGRVKPGVGDSKLENIVEVTTLWLDIDTGDATDRTAEQQAAFQKLRDFVLPPTVIVDSGLGAHAYWVLNKSATGDDLARIAPLNKALADIFQGDQTKALHHINGAMRLPGTVNLKYGKSADIIEIHPDRSYDLDTLEQTLFPLAPVNADTNTPEHLMTEEQRLLRAAKSMGTAPSQSASAQKKTDSEWDQIIDALTLPHKRNESWVQVVGKLYRDGYSYRQAVHWYIKTVLAQMDADTTQERRGLPDDEAIGIAQRIAEKEGIPVTDLDAPEDEQPTQDAPEDDTTASADAAPLPGTAAAKVARQIQKRASAGKAPQLQDILGNLIQAILDEYRLAGGDLIFTEDSFWRYTQVNGFWEEYPDSAVRADIDRMCRGPAFGWQLNNKHVNDVVGGLQRWTYMRKVDWASDKHLIAASNRIVIDTLTGMEQPVSKSHYLRENDRVNWPWVPGAQCPTWHAMIGQVFQHYPANERQAVIETVEEWLGSALLRGRSKVRDMRRIAIFYGPERTGKSTILEVMRRMVGDRNFTSESIDALGDTFSYEPLLNKMVWLIDEIPLNARISEAALKKLGTDEPITVKRKYKSALELRMDLTIGIAGNNLPNIQDTTNATHDRIIWIKCDTQFGLPGTPPIDVDLMPKLIAEEAGMFQHFFRAAQRLNRRKRFDLVPSLVREQREVADSLNPTRSFCELGMAKNQGIGVKNADITTAYYGFINDEYGTNHAQMTMRNDRAAGNKIANALRSLFPHVVGHHNGKVRLKRGIMFTDQGLRWLDMGRKLENPNYTTNQQALHEANVTLLNVVQGNTVVPAQVPGNVVPMAPPGAGVNTSQISAQPGAD